MWNYALKILSSMHQCEHFHFSDTDTDNNYYIPWNKKGRSPRTTTQATLFDIPEILAEVFSYLDEQALRRSVVLVCRDWFLMSLPRLSIREVVWDDTRANKEIDKVLGRLPGAFGLSWYSRPDRKGGIEASEPWRRLVIAIRGNFEQGHRRHLRQEQERHRRRSLGGGLVFRSLQKLELGGAIDLGMAAKTLLPLLPSLTVLEMHTHARCSVSMGSVLLACPLLEQIHVSSLSFGAVELSWSWIPFDHVSNNTRANNNPTSIKNKDRGNNDESSQRHPSSLPLRSFVLENTSVELSGLDSLLSLTPDLQELKLIQLSAPRTNPIQPSTVSPLSTVANITTFFSRLKNTLIRHGIILNSFHYSLDNETLPTAAARLDEIIREEICGPRANQWSFWTQADLPPFAFQILRTQIPNVVTTLELHGNKIGRCPMTGCKLHQYLCESPHLLHLKAPRTAFLVDHFDIHRVVDVTIIAYEAGTGTGAEAGHEVTVATPVIPSAGSSMPTTTMTGTPLPPIWKCRNLRTLHMAFRCSGQSYHPASLKILQIRTRILFGYISRVCPELRDLRIDTSFMDSAHYNIHEFKMYLAFEGGFCLLSRLHFLERLSVDAVCRRVYYEPWELSWMLGPEEPEQEEGRKDRRKVLAELDQRDTRLIVEGSAALQRDPDMTTSTHMSCTACGAKSGRLRPTTNHDEKGDYDDVQALRMTLENLGHVQDIIEVMDELETAPREGEDEATKCWPHLQKIALYRPNRYGLSRREEAIRQLVPDTFFRTLVRRTFY